MTLKVASCFSEHTPFVVYHTCRNSNLRGLLLSFLVSLIDTIYSYVRMLRMVCSHQGLTDTSTSALCSSQESNLPTLNLVNILDCFLQSSKLGVNFCGYLD